MSAPELHLVVPGRLDQRTGGYLYDARMAEGLRELGWTVVAHGLDGAFPGPDAVARDALERTLAGLPDGARVLLDGLAMGSLPGPVRTHAGRLRLLALVHHPLADETGLDPERRSRLERLEREALAACAGVVVTSASTAARMADYGVAEARVRVARPGTDRAAPATGPGAGQPPRLLCVGTVSPRKGQDVLVRALARLREARWTCVCAGSLERDPAYATAVRDRARAEGLQERITFTGELEGPELERLYRESSVFVLPSWHEGYGMALAEALARSLPVVTTRGGAIPETVTPEGGVLVPPGDDAALAAALAPLLEEPAGAERRARLAEAAARRARDLPDWAQATRALADALLALAPREGGAPGSAPVERSGNAAARTGGTGGTGGRTDPAAGGAARADRA